MAQTARLEKRAEIRDIRQDIGNQIAAARAMNGRISQGELARRLTKRLGWNVSRPSISDIERGAAPIHVEMLKAIRDELGGTYEFYLDGGYPGNGSTPSGVGTPRYVKPRDADVIDLFTRRRLAEN